MIRSLQITILFLAFISLQTRCFAEVTVFDVSTSKLPPEEAAELFCSKTGNGIFLHFCTSGAMLNLLQVLKKAPHFILDSLDHILKTRWYNLVDSFIEKVPVYLIPATSSIYSKKTSPLALN